MDENEPEVQFEATDYDKDGNTKLPPPPLAAAKKKRLTVVDLAKRFDELEEDIDATVFESLSTLNTRLEKIENGDLPDRQNVAEDIANRVDALENGLPADTPACWSEIDKRISNQDAAIGALADALRSHLEAQAATTPEPKPEIEFAQPPQQMAGEQTWKSDIEAVASICQTMTDVLLICRGLKTVRDTTDEDRTHLLTIACRAAGVPLSPGLQIRAGVRNVEA